MCVRLLTIAVVLLLALVGAGCGGGDDETAADTDPVVTETTADTTTDDDTTEDDTTDGDTTGDDTTSGIFSSGDCAELVAASASLSQAFAAVGGVEGDVDEATELFEDFAENAPDEIRDDLQVLAEAYATYVAALDDVDFEEGQVPDAQTLAALQQAIASIDQAEVTEASQNLTEWSTANC
jgi:hypothetical protein